MIHSGGIRVPDVVKETHKSIFREPGQTYKPRVHLPTENPKYPESKHTTKCAHAQHTQRSTATMIFFAARTCCAKKLLQMLMCVCDRCCCS